jgi:hypothetical protein
MQKDEIELAKETRLTLGFVVSKLAGKTGTRTQQNPVLEELVKLASIHGWSIWPNGTDIVDFAVNADFEYHVEPSPEGLKSAHPYIGDFVAASPGGNGKTMIPKMFNARLARGDRILVVLQSSQRLFCSGIVDGVVEEGEHEYSFAIYKKDDTIELIPVKEVDRIVGFDLDDERDEFALQYSRSASLVTEIRSSVTKLMERQ